MILSHRLLSVLAVMAKLAFGVAVFVSTVAAWAYFKPVVINRMALPDSVPDRMSDRCALWFIGSSSIERWDTMQRDIPGWQVHNRGVGGARLAQIEARSLRTTALIRPAGIVFYAGENDISGGLSGTEAASSMMRLVSEMAERWRGVPIFVIGLKPSPNRWSQRPEQLRYNAILSGFATGRKGVTFIPVGAGLMRGAAPDPSLYVDGVHLSDRGYAVWSADVRRGIDHGMPTDSVSVCTAPGRSRQEPAA